MADSGSSYLLAKSPSMLQACEPLAGSPVGGSDLESEGKT